MLKKENMRLPRLSYTFEKCYICHKELAAEERLSHLCHTCQCARDRKLKQLQEKNRSMEGCVALVTGGRIKIGYETSLALLRKGSTVLITTRFPADAAKRYGREIDFDEWSSRLMIYGIDFRDLYAVEKFIIWIQQQIPCLDVLVNNAAQTISRPEEYYGYLRKLEGEESSLLPEKEKKLLQNTVIKQADLISQSPLSVVGSGIDENGFLMDIRAHNSWVSKAWDVSLKEMLEVQVINVTVPFLLCSRLLSCFKRSKRGKKFIVNVSAMEGQFSKRNKNGFHPHTNMAKAALNMLTRTVAKDYQRKGIYVNSVDTGWITDENPFPLSQKNRRNGFTPPLTSKDGASRICDPFISYYLDNSVKPPFGKFLKDYHSVKW